MQRIRVKFEHAGEVIVELINRNPRTRDAFLEIVPFESRANLWGDEVYFTTPVEVDLENPQEIVAIGDVAYWPPGKAMCLFFGRTPISPSIDEIRPASPVNVFGKIVEGMDVLRRVREGEKLVVEMI